MFSQKAHIHINFIIFTKKKMSIFQALFFFFSCSAAGGGKLAPAGCYTSLLPTDQDLSLGGGPPHRKVLGLQPGSWNFHRPPSCPL